MRRLSGYCKEIEVTLYKDGSLEVADDGRGMPVDIHPKEKVSGVELILTRLHAGGKFSDKAYQFSGGLHGVGVSVVNALSKHLECWVRRDGKEYNITFKDGKVGSKLEVIGTVGARNTGTTVRFWPDPKFFDSDNFSVPQLTHMLKAKAVLCPGLRVTLYQRGNRREGRMVLQRRPGRLSARAARQDYRICPPSRSAARREAASDAVDCALVWAPQAEAVVAESYVNLIPDHRGRHARQRPALGSRPGGARVLRISQSRAARHQAHAGGYLGAGLLRAVGQDPRTAVRRPDQGAPGVARSRGAGGEPTCAIRWRCG